MMALRDHVPMFDAVMVRRESVIHTPQDSLGPTADSDLAVDRADVRLHGIRAEIRQLRDLGIALALRNEARISDSRSLSPSLGRANRVQRRCAPAAQHCHPHRRVIEYVAGQRFRSVGRTRRLVL